MTKRQARATSQQIEALVTYLEQHPHVALEFYTLEGRNTLQGNWEELAKHLNSLTPNGKVKDYKSWKIVSMTHTQTHTHIHIYIYILTNN